ncbi:hypothetical protein D9M69_708760 [compost metagenome]
MDGTSISNGAFDAFADGYFTGGLVEWAVGGGEYDRRAIERHVGSILIVLGGTSGLVGGQAVRVYPGCAQTTTACKAFNNLPQYGGIPHLAGESPFAGNNVF